MTDRLHFKIVRTRNKQFRAKIVAANGETLFWSETYTRRGKAVDAVDLLRLLMMPMPQMIDEADRK